MENLAFGIVRAVKVAASCFPAAFVMLALGTVDAIALPRAEAASDGATKTPAVRVMSYNIRNSAGDRKSKDNNWLSRRADLVRTIRGRDPDVMGLQEVLPDQLKWLEHQFADYVFVGEGRNADRKSGEASPVAFRKERFEVVSSGTFWLSETPDVPGSKSWNAAFPRICSYFVLKDRKTASCFAFANCHTDHQSELAREKGMLLIVEQMRKLGAGCPVVLVGDHNCLEYEKPAKSVLKLLDDALYISETPPEGSWRSFNFWSWKDKELTIAEALRKKVGTRDIPGHKSDLKRIDYIYVSKGTRVLDYRTVNDPRPGRKLYPSDHFPVVATLVFGKNDRSQKNRACAH